jgi:hypothetical protein
MIGLRNQISFKRFCFLKFEYVMWKKQLVFLRFILWKPFGDLGGGGVQYSADLIWS